MADIRCPRCGENNPDFLDVCQFCQTPLKSESMLHIGETPTKKNTGELESVLPEWLKDMRQQARSSAQEEADHVAAQPKIQKNEPPDLLAGLASQAEKTSDEDVPDWLASINPAAKLKPSAPSSPEPETDFFAQFNKTESKSAPISEASQEQNQSWMDKDTGQSPVPAEKDELSDWFSQAADQPAEPVNFEPTAGQDYQNYMNFMDAILQMPGFEAIMFITHDVDLAVIFANRILLIADGQLVADGKPQDVLRDLDRLKANRLIPTSLLALNLRRLSTTGRFMRAEALAHI